MVSIVCITYNHEQFIADAIDGFLMQKTNFDFEILIHDDASTDKTADIIKKYELKFPNIIKPIYQKENQYSKGIKVVDLNWKRAKGKYIALCEGDDYWSDPFKLQKQVDYMENNSDCTLCTHAVEKVTINKVRIGYERPYDRDIKAPTTDLILGGGYFVGTTSLLFPRNLIESTPDFYLNASVGDYPLQIYLASKGYAYYMNEVMGAYRIGVEGSWSQRQINGNDKREKQIYHTEQVINMLEGFNKYTNYKYNDAIIKKKNYYYFKIALLKKDWKMVRISKYYQSAGFKDKVTMFIKMYFPSYKQQLFRNLINKNLKEFRSENRNLS